MSLKDFARQSSKLKIAYIGQPFLIQYRQYFASSSDQSKSQWLYHFMRLPCAAVGTLRARTSSSGELLSMSCSWCDSTELRSGTNVHLWDSHDQLTWRNEVLNILRYIIEIPEFQGSKAPKVWAAAAIRSLHSHLNDSEALDLRDNVLGEWCMKSLRSPQRELRIAAGCVCNHACPHALLTQDVRFAIPAFLRRDINKDIHQKNRIDVLNYVKHISSRASLGELETLVLAWGQVAR